MSWITDKTRQYCLLIPAFWKSFAYFPLYGVFKRRRLYDFIKSQPPHRLEKISHRFVNECELCLAHKASQQKPRALGCRDNGLYIGSFPRSTHGNQFVLVIQDKFTKWVECIPQRAATSAGLRKATREIILCRFG